jgi:predicted  nucleic acid-binding Zn-ribbon protein
LASKETQGRLALLQNQPLEIFSDKTQYIQLFGELRKQIVDKSIQIKDPEKTIHQIDEIINSIPSLSSELKKLKEELSRLESSISSINMRRLEDMKSKTEMYEKYRSENVSKMGETKNSIFELDSSIDLMKKKIEENVLELTNTNYSIFRD